MYLNNFAKLLVITLCSFIATCEANNSLVEQGQHQGPVNQYIPPDPAMESPHEYQVLEHSTFDRLSRAFSIKDLTRNDVVKPGLMVLALAAVSYCVVFAYHALTSETPEQQVPIHCNYKMQYMNVEHDILAFRVVNGECHPGDPDWERVHSDVRSAITYDYHGKLPEAACYVCRDRHDLPYSFVMGTNGDAIHSMLCYRDIAVGHCNWSSGAFEDDNPTA